MSNFSGAHQFGTSFFWWHILPKSSIRLLYANRLFLSSVFPFFGYNGTLLRPQNVERHLLKNKSCYHHNANGRFGIIHFCRQVCLLQTNFFIICPAVFGYNGPPGNFWFAKAVFTKWHFFCEIVFLQLSFIFLLHRFA